MLIFKALHIVSMFAAVTILIGEEFFIALAIWRRDVGALATIHRLAGRRVLTVTGAILFLVGIAFGLLTAVTGGIDFFTGWLIAAYVLVAAIFLVNGSPEVQKKLAPLMDAAVEAEAGRRPVEDVVRDMAASRAVLVVAINVAFFVALILDMVLKPF